MEFFLNDFSAGLITKKAYARTDLDIFNKGLSDIKNATTNQFGNISNIKIDMIIENEEVIGSDIISNIKDKKYLIKFLDSEQDTFLITFNGVGNLILIKLSTLDVSSYSLKQKYITGGFTQPLALTTYPLYIFKINYITNNIIYINDGIIFDLNDLDNVDAFARDINNSTNKKAKVKKLEKQKEIIEFRDAGVFTRKQKKITKVFFKYDSRKKTAIIKTKIQIRSEVINPSPSPPSWTEWSVEMWESPKTYLGKELEILFGKFVYSLNPIDDFDKYKTIIESSVSETEYADDLCSYEVLKAPIKDTLKVDSAGNITIETIELTYGDILYQEQIPISFDEVFEKDNRLCLVKDNKIYFSKFNDYNFFSNIENSNSDAFWLDMPYEKYINNSTSDGLIIFSNRGIFANIEFLNPNTVNFVLMDSIVITPDIIPMNIFNGTCFVNNRKDNVYIMVFNGQTNRFEISNISSLIDIKNIESIDYLSNNEITNNLLLVNNSTDTYFFSFDSMEEYKAWGKVDKLVFDLTFFDIEGDTKYCKVDDVDNKLIILNEDISKSDFNFTLFKPDSFKGERTPIFFNRKAMVKEIEIMYTGNGKISIHNNSQVIPTVIVDKSIFINDINNYMPFEDDVKIAKSPVHFQWGDKLKFEVETEEEFIIYAINLKLE